MAHLLNLLPLYITHDWCRGSQRRTSPLCEIEKHTRNTQVFLPESEELPEHHSHPVCHRAHFLPTLFLIPRNLQNKSLCLKIPFNQIFQLASGSVGTVHSSSSDLEPAGNSVAAPAKYLSYFTKAKEDVVAYFLLRNITGITLLLWKSTKPNLLLTAKVENKTIV